MRREPSRSGLACLWTSTDHLKRLCLDVALVMRAHALPRSLEDASSSSVCLDDGCQSPSNAVAGQDPLQPMFFKRLEPLSKYSFYYAAKEESINGFMVVPYLRTWYWPQDLGCFANRTRQERFPVWSSALEEKEVAQ